MKSFIDNLILQTPFLQSWSPDFVYLGFQVAFGLLVLLVFVAPFAGITSWVERRVAARMMSRVGPNRVGPNGFLQWLADGIKCILKEDLIPAAADAKLFKFAPYLVFAGMFGAFVVIPFSSGLVIADLNVGIFYLLAVTSLVVVGILIGGWASNNKWSLLGGMRAAAQIVSYEIPSGLGILTIVLLTGSLSMQSIILSQEASPLEWNLFDNPFALLAFFVLFISSLAEGNRTPFDIPEAESELVSGYNTEYSGMRFLLFFFAEWANLYLIAAVATILFLGGWQIPETWGLWADGKGPAYRHGLELAVFMAKALPLVFVVIWLRWTLPRVRVDQLMILCWKYLTPMGFLSVLGTALWLVLFPNGVAWISLLLLGLAVLIFIYFLVRVIYQLRFMKADIHLNPFI